jgi:hypothetical protein
MSGGKAGITPRDWLVDNTLPNKTSSGYDSIDQVLGTIRYIRDSYQRDRQGGQSIRLMLWCESSGLVGAIRKYSRSFSVPVWTGARQDSLNLKMRVAQKIVDSGHPDRVIGHIADHDGKGHEIFDTLKKDVPALVRNWPGGEGAGINMSVESLAHL